MCLCVTCMRLSLALCFSTLLVSQIDVAVDHGWVDGSIYRSIDRSEAKFSLSVSASCRRCSIAVSVTVVGPGVWLDTIKKSKYNFIGITKRKEGTRRRRIHSPHHAEGRKNQLVSTLALANGYLSRMRDSQKLHWVPTFEVECSPVRNNKLLNPNDTVPDRRHNNQSLV